MKNSRAKPKDIITIIKEEQKKYVKVSYGEWEHQAFTDEDYAKFKNGGVVQKIENSLKQSLFSLETVLSL